MKRALKFLVYVFLLAVMPAWGEGIRPDPVKYRQALDAVLQHACKGFEKEGFKVDWKSLKFGDHEVIDSNPGYVRFC